MLSFYEKSGGKRNRLAFRDASAQATAETESHTSTNDWQRTGYDSQPNFIELKTVGVDNVPSSKRTSEGGCDS
mgnify:CR=1 FL=1